VPSECAPAILLIIHGGLESSANINTITRIQMRGAAIHDQEIVFQKWARRDDELAFIHAIKLPHIVPVLTKRRIGLGAMLDHTHWFHLSPALMRLSRETMTQEMSAPIQQ